MTRLLARSFSVLFLALMTTGSVFAAVIDSPLAERLPTAGGTDMLPVVALMSERPDIPYMRAIVQDVPRPNRAKIVKSELDRLVTTTQGELLRVLEDYRSEGRVLSYHSLAICNGVKFSATREVIETLADRDDIWIILDDTPEEVIRDWNPQPVPGELDEPDWGVERINAPTVWDWGYTGEGVIVSVLDTGVHYSHPDLEDHMWDGGDEYPNHGYDFYNNDNDPMDDHGHGSHCAGTVAGDGTGGTQTGVAPDATIMALKVLSGGGSGAQSAVWDAMDFVLDQGGDVISMSLGWTNESSGNRQTWRENFETLDVGGVTSAVAVGNERNWGYPPRSPGDCPSPWRHPDQTGTGTQGGVISIGATNQGNTYASFSTPGPAVWTGVPGYNDWSVLIVPDIAAPGVDITSCNNWGSGYQQMSGTSMATPHIAGVIALMLSKSELLIPAEIDSIMEVTSIDLGQDGKDNDYGSGLVQADSAVLNVNVALGHLQGSVVDYNTGEPVVGAAVNASFRRTMIDTTDEEGLFEIAEIPADTNWTVTVDHFPYQLAEFTEVAIDSADTTELDFELMVGILGVDQTTFEVQLIDDTTGTASFNMENTGSAPVDVSMRVRPVINTAEFMDSLFAWQVGDSTGDQWLRGIQAGNDRIYVSGSNNSSNPNKIYSFDLEGNYLGAVDQPTTSMTGIYDLAFDGVYLYGGRSRQIVKFDPETGEEVDSFEGPYHPNRALAYDMDNMVLYVAQMRNDIVIMDPTTGEEIGYIDSNLRIQAMDINPFDEEGYTLWAVVDDPSGTNRDLYRINPETGDIQYQGVLEAADERSVFGITFIESWAMYYDTMVGLVSGSDGYDYAKGYEIDLSVGWLSLSSDELTIEPEGSAEVTMYFDAHGLENGNYGANLFAEHNTLQAETVIEIDLVVDLTHVEGFENVVPRSFSLADPYPNPFNSTARIQFEVPETAPVTLALYDVLGRRAAVLHQGALTAGSYNLSFSGENLASGVYFLHMSSPGQFNAVRKMLLVK
ncbi:S8 family serine peptidase [bacterium]|nr:S8 family serine peptidase [bacterium]